MDQDEFQKAYGKLVAKAWSDDDFKAKLLLDPMKVFSENEIAIPEGVEVRMVENTDNITYLILPQEPSNELSLEQLDQVVGGNYGGAPDIGPKPADPNYGGDPNMGG
jgi:hypothetical protein